MKTTAKNSIVINSRLVPWSFVWCVHAACGHDWDATIDCFWKARNCTGNNGIQRYIMRGLKPDAVGKKYILVPSRERENGKMESLRQWWEGLYERKGKPEFKEDAAALVAALSKKFGM